MFETALWSSCALAGVIIIVFAKVIPSLSSEIPYHPPSPPGDLVLGHAWRIPLKNTHKKFSEWGKTLGMFLSSVPRKAVRP